MKTLLKKHLALISTLAVVFTLLALATSAIAQPATDTGGAVARTTNVDDGDHDSGKWGLLGLLGLGGLAGLKRRDHDHNHGHTAGTGVR